MNAGLNVAISATGGYIFKSASAGGVDSNRARSLTILNTGTKRASAKCTGMHPVVTASSDAGIALPLAADQRVPIPANGGSITLRRADNSPLGSNFLDAVHVRCEDAAGTTIDFGITED